jgi:hypothetical protein
MRKLLPPKVMEAIASAEFEHSARTEELKTEFFIFNCILLPKIKQLCISTILAVRDRLERVAQGFEWLGFDIMVTESLEVLLIEVNVSPDISRSTVVTSPLVRSACASLFDVLGCCCDASTTSSERSDNRDSCSSNNNSGASGSSSINGSSSPWGSSCWQLWYQQRSAQTLMQLARSKRDVAVLSKDYLPRDTALADYVLHAFNFARSQSASESNEYFADSMKTNVSHIRLDEVCSSGVDGLLASPAIISANGIDIAQSAIFSCTTVPVVEIKKDAVECDEDEI